MPGAPQIQPSPESRRPRSRADPQAATDCSPAYGNPPRNIPRAPASREFLIARFASRYLPPNCLICLTRNSRRRGGFAWLLAVASTGFPAGGWTLKPRGGQLHPPAFPLPVGGNTLLPCESGLACGSAPALTPCWRGQDMLAGRRGKVGDDPQRIMHVSGGSNGKPDFSRLRSARPSAPGKVGRPLSLDRGGP